MDGDGQNGNGANQPPVNQEPAGPGEGQNPEPVRKRVTEGPLMDLHDQLMDAANRRPGMADVDPADQVENADGQESDK